MISVPLRELAKAFSRENWSQQLVVPREGRTFAHSLPVSESGESSDSSLLWLIYAVMSSLSTSSSGSLLCVKAIFERKGTRLEVVRAIHSVAQIGLELARIASCCRFPSAGIAGVSYQTQL